MVTRWHPDAGTSPTPRDAELMVELLEARHGEHAEAIADFFRLYNEHQGTPGKAWTWAMLSERIARRREARLTGR
jgi:hypothetical protein